MSRFNEIVEGLEKILRISGSESQKLERVQNCAGIQHRYSIYHFPGLLCPKCGGLGLAKIAYEGEDDKSLEPLPSSTEESEARVFDRLHQIVTDAPFSVDPVENASIMEGLRQQETPWLCLQCHQESDSVEFIAQLRRRHRRVR